jgi:hypothetical protein
LVEWHNAVVTADVIAERGVYYLYGDIPYTIYTIKTSQVIAGANLSLGDEVQFLVPGGPRPGGGWA